MIPASDLTLHAEHLPGPSDVTAVFVHGVGMSAFSWRHVLPRAAEYADTYAVDLLGFGESPRPWRADYTVTGHAARLIQWMDQRGISSAVLCGHSLGGGVALATSVMSPERVRGLVLVATAALPQRLPRFVRWSRFPGAWLFLSLFAGMAARKGVEGGMADPNRADPADIDRFAQGLRPLSGAHAFVQTSRLLTPDHYQQIIQSYPQIDVPVLIVHGVEDRVVPVDVAIRLQKILPHAQLHLVDRIGHLVPLESPNEVLRVLAPFLRERILAPLG